MRISRARSVVGKDVLVMMDFKMHGIEDRHQEKRLTESSGHVACLSHDHEMTCFSFGGRNIRFRTSARLTRYKKVLSWEKGFIEVVAQYGEREEEEYIDLVSILQNLYIDPESYLSPIQKVEVSYV